MPTRTNSTASVHSKSSTKANRREHCPSKMQMVIVAFERALDVLREDLSKLDRKIQKISNSQSNQFQNSG